MKNSRPPSSLSAFQLFSLSAFQPRQNRRGFTLIELLVVISIIAILMGLLFPAFKGVQDQAKKTQAKNDCMQIITAVNAFYTEYGQYPCGAQPGGDSNDFVGGDDSTGAKLFTDLRGISGMSDAAINPKTVTFINIPVSKDTTHANAKNGICSNGHWHDPWGTPYRVKIDNNYNNQITNPYSANAGFGVLNTGVIAWSFGKDGKSDANPGPASDKKTGVNEDDVISWQ